MKDANTYLNRLSDKTLLLLKFNYISSALSLLFGLFCIYILHIDKLIPHVFIGYCIINLINTWAFSRHGNLTIMAIVTSFLSLISTLIITLCSGGINSPFIFVMAIIVLAGYVSTSFLGKIYLYAIILTIVGIYLHGILELGFFVNEVPAESKDSFGLLSVLFSIYLLGVVFGRNLLKVHHQLYKSKSEVEQRIKEKENLLREVHHRVKNNLQTISSLLNLQANSITDRKFKNLIKSSQNRVISMAMIHEMLYLKEDLSQIEYKTYVQDLILYLTKSFTVSKSNIAVNIDMPDINLGIDTAVPLGLLINEVITNSLKYGFNNNDEGQIDILLKGDQANNSFVLSIGDNGIGFSDDIDFTKTKSLGLKLIHNLAKQLNGTAEKDHSKKGTNYIIRFKNIDQQFKSVA